jgi:hypothetical protein
MIEAWASMKSVRPKDGSGEPPAPGRNREADFHGERRTNETHQSTTDPDARLYRKGPGREARLGFIGHALMENRNGLVVDACLTHADGHAERVAALHMIEPRADRPRRITWTVLSTRFAALGDRWRMSSDLVGRVVSTVRQARGLNLGRLLTPGRLAEG